LEDADLIESIIQVLASSYPGVLSDRASAWFVTTVELSYDFSHPEPARFIERAASYLNDLALTYDVKGAGGGKTVYLKRKTYFIRIYAKGPLSIKQRLSAELCRRSKDMIRFEFVAHSQKLARSNTGNHADAFCESLRNGEATKALDAEISRYWECLPPLGDDFNASLREHLSGRSLDNVALYLRVVEQLGAKGARLSLGWSRSKIRRIRDQIRTCRSEYLKARAATNALA
jgi:hypothetical protein